jgi:hypothetical protein
MTPLKQPEGLHWKYRLRLSLVPVLARLGHYAGLSWPKLGERLGSEVIIAQGRTMSRNGRKEKAEQPLDIIFLTMLGGHRHNTAVDVVLGLALQRRGHRVRYVVCDQCLPACEVKKAGQEANWTHACAKCWGYGRSLFKAYGFEVIPVSRLSTKAVPEAETWSEIIEAALLKHYGVGILEENQAVQQRRAQYATAAGISAAVGRSLVSMKPDRVIMSHGIYCTWGPQRALLNNVKIPVITYSKCKKKHTEKFNWTTGGDWWDVTNEWERVRDVPLDKKQEALIDAYLYSRRNHSKDTLQYNFGDEESLDKTYSRLGLSPDKQTFVLFTNVLWDAASAQREIAFKDPIDWVVQTINWFGQHKDRQLVVKIHPAEVVIGTNQPFAEIIRERIDELPANVRMIEPQEKVNSWSIMRIADLGLVHTSTVGMEMPLEGISCMVVSRTHFRGKGFTVDTANRNEYFQTLENWDSRLVDRNQLKMYAKRYAFLLFERYQMPFKLFHETAHSDVRAVLFKDVKELTSYPTTHLVVERIEKMGDFLLPNEADEIIRFYDAGEI